MHHLIIRHEFPHAIACNHYEFVSLAIQMVHGNLGYWNHAHSLCYLVAKTAGHGQTWVIFIFEPNPQRPHIVGVVVLVVVNASVVLNYPFLFSRKTGLLILANTDGGPLVFEKCADYGSTVPQISTNNAFFGYVNTATSRPAKTQVNLRIVN